MYRSSKGVHLALRGSLITQSSPTRRTVASLAAAASLLVLTACGSNAPAAKSSVVSPTQPPRNAPTASASPRAGASPSPSPSPSVPIARVEITDASIGDATPWISLKNTTGDPIILTGWKLQVGDQTATIPGNAIAQPGETLTMHVETGESSERDIYLGTEGEALAKAGAPGTAVKLMDPDGKQVSQTTIPRY
jgi:lamin tail-like protein